MASLRRNHGGSPRARKCESDAEFDRFVEAASDGLIRTGYLMTMDMAEAEDLVQECLVRVAGRWRRARRMSRPEAYARRILINLVLDGSNQRSRRQRELRKEPPELTDQTDPLDLQLARSDEVTRALATLTARQRAVVVLRFIEDLSESQVAEILDCSVGNVKSTSARALTLLRHEVMSDRESPSATGAAAAQTPAGLRVARRCR